MSQASHNDSRVAVLVDCDNTSPDVLEHALRVVAQFGRVVLRRGYGNHGTLDAEQAAQPRKTSASRIAP